MKHPDRALAQAPTGAFVERGWCLSFSRAGVRLSIIDRAARAFDR